MKMNFKKMKSHYLWVMKMIFFSFNNNFKNIFLLIHNIQSQKKGNKKKSKELKRSGGGQPRTTNEVPVIPCDLVNGRWVDFPSTTPTVAICVSVGAFSMLNTG